MASNLLDYASERTGFQRREGLMTAYLVLTENEPMIVVMPKPTADDTNPMRRLADAGGERFIAHEVDVELLREQYGVPFEIIEDEIRNGKDVRVLDAVGHRVLDRISLSHLGGRVVFEC
jgi:hypothetical protein